MPLQLIIYYDHFILGISQSDCHFLRRLLKGYSKLKDFWSNDLPYVSKVFLNGLLLGVL